MTKRYGRVLGSAVLIGGLAFAGASKANAQVAFRGSFPLPHGRITISAGDPVYPAYQVGAYAPDNCDIYQDPDYGYGFVSGTAFFPVRAFNGRWVVNSAPTFFSGRYADWREARVYRRAGDRVRYERPVVRQDDRRSDRRDYDQRNDRRDDRKNDRRDGNDRWRRN